MNGERELGSEIETKPYCTSLGENRLIGGAHEHDMCIREASLAFAHLPSLLFDAPANSDSEGTQSIDQL